MDTLLLKHDMHSPIQNYRLIFSRFPAILETSQNFFCSHEHVGTIDEYLQQWKNGALVRILLRDIQTHSIFIYIDYLFLIKILCFYYKTRKQKCLWYIKQKNQK